MLIDLATLPHPDFLPIPTDVQPNDRWSPLMTEIADHIGARNTLLLVDHFGGQVVRMPRDPARNPFRALLGDAVANELSRVFAGERLELPVGKAALIYARRQGVLAEVRAGKITLTEAACILRTPRRYLTELINGTDEGMDGGA